MILPNAESHLLIEKLTGYLRPADIDMIHGALMFSDQAHEGQFRVSGEPYITHPVAVAHILADMKLDGQAVAAGLLHDVMEDTDISKPEIAARFGKQVAELVDGVSKLERIEFQTKEEAQAENFRKMLLAMARDVRVILIKLADRLHNMRTLGPMAPDKRQRIARETMDIYAPIANRIGLNAFYQELEDLAFSYLYPDRFRVLSKAIKTARGNRREVVGRILTNINQRLTAQDVESSVSGREKHLYSVYRKMREKHLSFTQVLDIFGFRVIVKDAPSCYLALGVLHGLYKPIPGKFKDYIAIPKANGYQSLHTALIGPFGTPIEVQIRTAEMHRISEAGVAAHWMYKTSDAAISEAQQKTHQWLQSLLEIQSTSGDSAEFLEHIKVDLFPDEVYVFTPKGKIMSLPRGTTAVDFAYSVHTDVGNHCVAVKINGELMPLRTMLRNGDRVEVITAAHAKPNPSWLTFVVTGKARSQVRHYMKSSRQEESAVLGERLLRIALESIGPAPNKLAPTEIVPKHFSLEDITDQQWDRLLRDTGARSRRDIMADIGVGKRLAAIVARRLLARKDLPDLKSEAGPVVIHGTEGLAVQFAKCCSPIPGDPIVGVIKKGQGLVVHTHDCQQIRKHREVRAEWLDVEWSLEIKRNFDVSIRATALNKPGVLAKQAAAIASSNSNIVNVRSEDTDNKEMYSTILFTMTVENRVHLAQVLKSLRQLPEVVRLSRIKG